MPYVVEKRWSGNQVICPMDVIGTDHPDYQGIAWYEFFSYGRRVSSNLRLLEQNPNYFTMDEIKIPPMYFIELNDGGLYVHGDGMLIDSQNWANGSVCTVNQQRNA